MSQLRRPRRISTQEALSMLQSMSDCESDGGDVGDLGFQNENVVTDSSSDEDATALAPVNPPLQRCTRRRAVNYVIEQDSSNTEATSDEEDTTHASPPHNKRQKVADVGTIPGSTEKAKDGTVWFHCQVGDVFAHETPQTAFSGSGGPTEFARRKITSRLQSFLCLVDMTMLLTIRDCTVHEGRRTNPSWQVSVFELMAFLAILFRRAAKGYVGSMQLMWTNRFGNPDIKAIMPRNRFFEIKRYLRFDNKDTRKERIQTDKFAAISDIWQRFVQNCVSSYSPGQHVTVDEQVFPSKVRCPFLQYIASKPNMFGIKFWIAADLETKFMCNAIPYLGKDPTRPTGERLSENVVLKLMEPFMDQGRTVTLNNFFTSLSLANRLLKRKTTLLGAINKNRQELPATAKETSDHQLYSTQVFTSGRALLTVYTTKKKSVCLLSTIHQKVEIVDTRKQKPNAVVDYNHFKCCSDIMEQKLRNYSVRAGTRRWPMAVFYNLLDLAAANAHILYTACTGSKESRQLFMLELAEELQNCLLQEKAEGEERKQQCREMRVSQKKKTQCQVRILCNNNRSTKVCVHCRKYTCAKCRKDSPWECGNC
ncbi:uncharacterized protein LOC124869915 [Girardinichthys multiradiatus]|uniref:uncharacterized protein LOC124869915 n=1 Tax=Girardinichthys multiradiatus TaxID=208333 RepID=UPI001FACC9DE|nr:uncharacterized protein LOC124869915 [Girardinichthys multiradiatus]